MNRRHFLTHSASAAALAPIAAATARAASAPPAAMPAESDAFTFGPLPQPVVKPGEFVFAAAHHDHNHLVGQCSSLIAAGGTLKWVFEPDTKKRDSLLVRFKPAKPARALDEILADPEVKLVTAAAITSERGPLGCRVMEAGKDYFTDKAPFTTLDQLAAARAVAARTGRKYMVNYGERLGSEAGMAATELVQRGVVGRVIQVIGLGPHRLNAPTRPKWFFERAKYGGILCDIGSHQCEQFLTYAGVKDATVAHAAVGNFSHPDKPELEDFGAATFVGDNGATNQIRVDWFTPDGLGNWGDGRTFILGTKGYIELRKYIDVARAKTTDHVFFVDGSREHYLNVKGKVGHRFFGELILDCLRRTEKAMTQAHAFKAAELCLKAQAVAVKLA